MFCAGDYHTVVWPVRGVRSAESSFSGPHQNAQEDGEEMTEPSHAVFLSYASEDAEAAERIADALRAARIEVWFDRNALRGGDEWDRKIRWEIKDCALFVPIISANSEARHEGYFRLEWDLADQRSHMIARGRPFLVPVGLDETRAEDAGVPDSFQRVQWTRLSGGATPREFIERIGRLLSASQARVHVANAAHAAPGVAPPAPAGSTARPLSPHLTLRVPRGNGGGPGIPKCSSFSGTHSPQPAGYRRPLRSRVEPSETSR